MNVEIFDFLPLLDTLNIVLGSSSSGKTSFFRLFLSFIASNKEHNIYVFPSQWNSIESVKKDFDGFGRIIFLEGVLDLETVEKLVSPAIIFCDDFRADVVSVAFLNKLTDFLCHHKRLTFFLTVHQITHTSGLKSFIFNAKNLFITWRGGSSNSFIYDNRRRFNQLYHFWGRYKKRGVEQYEVIYYNQVDDILVPFVNELWTSKSCSVFMAGEEYILHSINVDCRESVPQSEELDTDLTEYFDKRKHGTRALILAKQIKQSGIMTSNLLPLGVFLLEFVDFLIKPVIHKTTVAKRKHKDYAMFCVLKYLLKNKVSIPYSFVVNPVAREIIKKYT